MTLYLLNLCDMISTLYALPRGGVELNPLMQSVPVMVAWKVVGVGVLCWWLSSRTENIAKQGLKILTLVYAVLNINHLIFILGVRFL